MAIVFDVILFSLAAGSIITAISGISDIALMLSVAGICSCVASLVTSNMGAIDLPPPPPE